MRPNNQKSRDIPWEGKLMVKDIINIIEGKKY